MIDSDSDSDSWLIATTPGDCDSDSDSDSAPLEQIIITVLKLKLDQQSSKTGGRILDIIHTLIFLNNGAYQYPKFELLKIFADRFSNISVKLHLSISLHLKLFLIKQNHGKFQQFLLPHSHIN